MSESEPRVAPWEDIVLRLIAIYKLAKTVLFLAIGIGLIRIMHHNAAEILRVYVINPMHFDPENQFLQPILTRAARFTKWQIELGGFVSFFYALLFGTEGVGLYLRKHWAEYMVLISTASLLPIEFWGLYMKVEAWKVVVTMGNLAILAYLSHRIWLDAHAPKEENLSEGPPANGESDHRQERSSEVVSKVR